MKAIIQEHRGDLDAAETACADMEIGLNEFTDTASSSHPTARKRRQSPDSALLDSLQKRVLESGTILEKISKDQQQQQPITARTAFANYVKDSLLTMPKAKYKRARSTINKLLSNLMDENSDDDIASALIPATHQDTSQPPQPVRPSSTPASFGFFGSEQYQPPHTWKHAPPVWEYMEQYRQPIQTMHQHVPTSRQHSQHHHTTMSTPVSTPVSSALGSAGQALMDEPIPDTLPNISGLSDIMRSPDLDVEPQPEKK